MCLEEQDAVDVARQRCRCRVTHDDVDVAPSVVFDPLARDSGHLLAHVDPDYLPCCTDDRPELPEARPRAAPDVEDMIARAQPEAGDRTSAQRGHEAGVSVVPGSEPTVSPSSFGRIRLPPQSCHTYSM